jgi:hypothetical protein
MAGAIKRVTVHGRIVGVEYQCGCIDYVGPHGEHRTVDECADSRRIEFGLRVEHTCTRLLDPQLAPEVLATGRIVREHQ